MTGLDVVQSNKIAQAKLVGRDETVDVTWTVPDEMPVAFVFNGHTHAIMLATPTDLEDFAYGFSFSEKIIDRPEDIKSLEVRHKDQGIDLLITLEEGLFERYEVKRNRRSLMGTSSCGICGIDSVEALFEPMPEVSKKPVELVYRDVIATIAEFQQQQPMRKKNHSVHGAAWVAPSGSVTLVREDVGRHNAMDKLVGAMLRSRQTIKGGYGLVSSRASYEMVSKAIRMRIPALVSLSAPTAFAIRTAKSANMTLCNWIKDGGLVVF